MSAPTPVRRRTLETAIALRRRGVRAPSVGIILGTGLGGLGDAMRRAVRVPYTEIPHFPVSTSPGHKGALLFGTLAGQPVVVLEGRFHYYEGYSLADVTYPVRVLRALGVQTLILSNAAGGLNLRFKRGDLMLINDHINLMGANPLIGPNDDALGPRFPDMCRPYDARLLTLATHAARRARLPVREGVYVAVTGPCLETRAEYRFLRAAGVDAVGMSTVPEVIVAVHAGLRVLAVSVITDTCNPDTLQPVDIAEIIRVAGEAEPRLTKLVLGVLKTL